MHLSRRIIVLAGAAALLLGATVLAWTIYSERERSAQIALGQQLYGAYCASCHGAGLQGEPDWQSPKPDGLMPAPPHDASGHTWHHSDEELFRITKFGMAAVVPNHRSAMPAFGGALSDREIEATLEYIKSTWSERERAYQRERSRL
ncbi:c-type cytochrome [Microvirga roseola]|uniref:c-type cytochrome n=1 Tax=Microvirga roseola TaxID=2883126 RepID=UPI001E2F7729|nr:cytochrome c [Microvirga roseola]